VEGDQDFSDVGLEGRGAEDDVAGKDKDEGGEESVQRPRVGA